MVVSPEQAGESNNNAINKEVANLEKIIDSFLTINWHDSVEHLSIMPLIVAKELKSFEETILALLFAKYVEAGWKIEKQHEPDERWIFRRR
jgi:hypothetical protein